MQDLIMEISNHFATETDSSSECEESDEDVDENSEKEYSGASHVCEKLIEKESYILGITATRVNNPQVALALSNNTVEIYNLYEDFVKFTTLPRNLGKTVELKFNSDDLHLLWTATYDGTINLWDLRSPERVVSSFSDTTDDKVDKDRKFNCFDISPNGKLLCAGTDTFEGDSFILFWDVRNLKLAGGFWESHTDDITQVKFHHKDSRKLLSGSTDGLINIYDLTQTCEDDALVETLNTESSIEKLTVSEFEDIIGCITHTADVRFWRNEEVEPYISLSRSTLAKHLRRKSENYIYLVDLHSTYNGSVLLAGSNAKSGQCARGMKLEKSIVKPAFGLIENKQRIRCSWLNENINILLTGGEKGYLNAWKLDNHT